ncbi:hypothetical protein CXF72_05900 [Psychromonas sp. MB-3u-54]|uniref:porin n=1 Tax=Psychromonas sp. MB-3u-54 TaxID=2058319 RepID=UPI000C33FA0E|nr:porin [Psychromonas sp. MB-3u-54]PKH03520.1 hypothetical protein CXF72_05900 [Psychromonas sp. MB-3u-54]
MTMNKAILPAIISALLATSAQAATLYEVADTTVKMSGELDAYYKVFDKEGTGVETEVDENGVISTWANLQFDLSTEISDSVTAMGSFEVEVGDGTAVVVDDAWMGVTGNFGTLKVGETGSSFALMEKTEVSSELNEYDAIYSDSETDGRAVRYQKALGPVDLSANYSFASDTLVEGVAVGDIYALSADYARENFTIGVAYLNGDTVESMGVSASVVVDALYAALTYTDNDKDSGVDFTTAALSASYAFAPATLYGSYQMQDFDGTDTDLNHWYAGVSRDVTANITTFVEYSDTDQDDALQASQFVAGVYYTF